MTTIIDDTAVRQARAAWIQASCKLGAAIPGGCSVKIVRAQRRAAVAAAEAAYMAASAAFVAAVIAVEAE